MPQSNHPWPLSNLEKEWPKVKNAPYSFLLCLLTGVLIGGIAIIFLYEHFIIHGLENDNHHLERDNGKLTSENQQIKTERDNLNAKLQHIEFSWVATSDLFFTNTIERQLVSQIVLSDKGWYIVTMSIYATNTITAGVKCWIESTDPGMLFNGELWVSYAAPVQNITHGGTHTASTLKPSDTLQCQLSFHAEKQNTVIALYSQQIAPENTVLLIREGSQMKIEKVSQE